jgi:hypothetical protein
MFVYTEFSICVHLLAHFYHSVSVLMLKIAL